MFLIILSYGCALVELDEQVAGNTSDPIDLEEPLEESRVDLGSQTIPDDAAIAAEFLHGETSRRWDAIEFVVRGMGISRSLDCRLDDFITLFADGTLEYESGQWACGGAESNAIDRNGQFSITNADPQDFQVSFTNIDGFEGSTFEGSVVTLEEGVLVLTSSYQSSIFGNFVITGRYEEVE